MDRKRVRLIGVGALIALTLSGTYSLQGGFWANGAGYKCVSLPLTLRNH